MTQESEKRGGVPRKRWWPVFTAGILGLHGLVFLALVQCGGKVSGGQKKVSYINIQNIAQSEVSFGLEEPPERMFYQFASMPLAENEAEPQSLSGRRWSGYETLVALKEGEYTPIENYRLTIGFEQGVSQKIRPIYYRPEFRTVVVRGVPMQPVSPVPEPGSTVLFCLAALGVLGVRKRS